MLNNPLSYTDPTGFFFKSLFRAIGQAFGKIFSAIGRAFKKLLSNPIVRAVVQIVGCAITAAPTGGMGCVAISGALSGIATGSLEEGLKAAAFAFISAGTFDIVGAAIQGMTAVGQAVVHGVVNGALNVAQGGNFLVGMATGALGKIGGIVGQAEFGLAGTGDMNAVLGRTMFAAAAGCAGAVIAKGSCGQGAFQAGLAHLFNAEGVLRKDQVHPMQKSYDDMRANGTFRGSFEQYLDYTSGRVNDASWIYDVAAGVGGVVKAFGRSILGGVQAVPGKTQDAYLFAKGGREFVTKDKNWRFAPFGNRTGHPSGKWPHYHRRGIDPKTGQTRPGQTIKRHRPWETKNPDKSFWDRF